MSKRNMVPTEHRAAIMAELGTVSDAELAAKWSEKIGAPIAKHTIFWMRQSQNIPAKHPRKYSKTAFRGRLEDTYPEVREMIGRLPIKEIASHFGVSRTCVRFAAYRLGINNPRAVKFDVQSVAREAKKAVRVKKR